MNPAREEDLFALTLKKSPAERAAWLDCECTGDAKLRARLDALLAAHDRLDGALAEAAPSAKTTIKIEFAEPSPDRSRGTDAWSLQIIGVGW